jgi:hypothetical protein
MIVTLADKKRSQKAKQQIADGKGISLTNFLVQALAHDSKKRKRKS